MLFILPTSFSPLPTKDILPTLHKSNMIYQFSCHCDSRYVGYTSQRLQNRIEPHVSKPIRSPSSSQKRLFSVCQFKSSIQTNTQFFASDSATRLHFLPNLACAQHYYDSIHSFLAQGRSPFHLPAFEANFIKTSDSALRRQKVFL